MPGIHLVSNLTMNAAFLPLVASLVPVALAVAVVATLRKRQERNGLRSPIANKRIHGAGEELRKRIDEQTREIMRFVLTLLLVGPYFFAVWALNHVQWNQVVFGTIEIPYLIAAAAMTIWAIRRLVIHGAARRRAIAGLRAELFTAQELNRLLAKGCAVAHDLPGDHFNIDHVVIGPHVVYVVETKSIRKPPGRKREDTFKVAYDGKSLRFPHFVTRAPIIQAQKQAQWLARYLRDTINQPVRVIPAVALPGWWIYSPTHNRDCAVPVFNPAGLGAEFMADPQKARPFDAATVAQIKQALVMRYPMEG